MSLISTATQPKTAPAPGTPVAPPRDSFREMVETVVFVVALVLMLKLFTVEAFVIPTGSMAETLYGIQKLVTCPDCGHEYPVNSTEEVEPQDGVRHSLSGACCPNCRFGYTWKPADKPSNSSGDRVLVHKAIYAFRGPERADVVVFKFPVDPQLNQSAQNYIKRLWGLGGETIAVHRGDLYVTRGLSYPADEVDSLGVPRYPRPDADQADRVWEGPEVNQSSRTRPPYISLGLDFTYHNAPAALEQFARDRAEGFAGAQFQILRKSDAVALGMRRIVYDNEHQSGYLQKKGVPPRWRGEAGWAADVPAAPRVFTHAGDAEGRLGYSHRVSAPPTQMPNMPFLLNDWRKAEGGYQDGLFPAGPITNFLGYNTAEENGESRRQSVQFAVTDLMLEATAKLSAGAAVTLELSKGTRRFRAVFTEGRVRLLAVGPGGGELATAPTRLAAGGSYDLRFSDFDGRLRVAVDGRAIDFGAAADLPPWGDAGFDAACGALLGAAFVPASDGTTAQHDLAAPAGVLASGGVEVKNLRLWQDSFFTPAGSQRFADADPYDPIDTFYVQPGHYLCLGDNSGHSLDSRFWGLVPERLMLGKAQFVFWPRNRIGFIK